MNKLSDLYDFQYGKGNNNPDNGGKYPIYGSNGIIGGYHEYNSEDAPVIGHIGANCGEVVFAKGKHYVTYNGVICTVKKGVDKRYAYYVLLSSKLKERVRGSAQPFISYDLLNEVEVEIPPQEIQEKIGAILWNIDEKIANNNAINAELEAMAKTIYYYWFLQFEFPDENGKPYKSSGGKMVYNEELKREIPENWEVKTVGDILVEQPKSSIQVGQAKAAVGEIPFFTSGEEILRVNESLVTGLNCYLNTGGNADVKLYNGNASYSTDTWCITSHDKLKCYFGYYLLSLKSILDVKFFQGTGLKHLQKPLLKKEYIIIPTDDVLRAFSKTIEKSTLFMSNNSKQNQELASLRDFLLPLLMNGQVGFKEEA